MNKLTAISPVDGRYRIKTEELAQYFSEYGLIKYRVLVEVEYFLALKSLGLKRLEGVNEEQLEEVFRITEQFDLKQAFRIKEIESITNHDVKAVEYYLKEKFNDLGLEEFTEMIHFGLTSQDINNTAIPLSFKHALENEVFPMLDDLILILDEFADEWANIPMLARTHGQPASPTTLGKEIKVFVSRLRRQFEMLMDIPFEAKFGGATGNFNAHYVAYPDIEWVKFAREFLSELGLERLEHTTQISNYDLLAAQFHAFARINTILIDLCRDMWHYISIEYFKQKVVPGEVGSSAMPHKVNPIDFENAEGNLGFANAMFEHLASKLPISRLQRDLTDSTVLRNIGMPVAHTLIALKSLQKGMGKLELNQSALENDLENNWAVVAEAIQNILRREGYPKPYEVLKELTRGKSGISKKDIRVFIEGLNVDDSIKKEMLSISPQNYIGNAAKA